MMTLGHYPEMSLLDARQARDANKQLLNKQINPKSKQVITNSNKLFKDMIKNACRIDARHLMVNAILKDSFYYCFHFLQCIK